MVICPPDPGGASEYTALSLFFAIQVLVATIPETHVKSLTQISMLFQICEIPQEYFKSDSIGKLCPQSCLQYGILEFSYVLLFRC